MQLERSSKSKIMINLKGCKLVHLFRLFKRIKYMIQMFILIVYY